MNIVIVELRNEILASESPDKLSVDDLALKYPKGTIYISDDAGDKWAVINRGSPVTGMRFSSRPRLFAIAKVSLPEIVRLAAMMAN